MINRTCLQTSSLIIRCIINIFGLLLHIDGASPRLVDVCRPHSRFVVGILSELVAEFEAIDVLRVLDRLTSLVVAW